MTYPGTPNLADDVQRRVLSTFESMLREVVQGNHQEALMGCGLIERLDPGFKPAAELKARLEATDGSVSVEDLAAALDIDLPEADPDVFAPTSAAAQAAPEPPVAQEPPAPDPATTDPPTTDPPTTESAPVEPHEQGAEIEQIETVETEAFEDTGERVDVMTHQEMREAMIKADAENVDGDPIANAGIPSEASTEELVAAVVGHRPAGATPAEDPSSEAPPVEQPPVEQSPIEKPPVEQPPVEQPSAEQALPTPTDETAPIESPAEPEDARIAALMQEGQAAFDAGEYQTAIDAWSRVFLIDLDHTAASERVEEARRLMAEREREAEELFHVALEKLRAGDSAGARKTLEATLERQPGHIGAHEHLDRLKAGVVDPPAGATAGDLTADPTEAIPPPSPVPVEAATGAGGEAASADVEAKPSEGKILGLSPRFLAVAVLGVVLVLAAFAFLYSRRDAVFPNTAEAGQSSIHSIERAQRHYAQGRLQTAIDTLEMVPATDERHSEAQALLERWRQEAVGAQAEALAESEAAAADEAARRAALIVQARQAVDNGLPHRALAPLVVAGQMARLNAEEQQLQKLAEEQLRPYGEAWLAYKDGDYRSAVRPLWERVRDNPDDEVARDLLIATQFNLARGSLIGGNPSEAAAMLSEAAKLAPRDPQIQQALRFAEHYVGQPQDLRYRIFIKYLPVR